MKIDNISVIFQDLISMPNLPDSLADQPGKKRTSLSRFNPCDFFIVTFHFRISLLIYIPPFSQATKKGAHHPTKVMSSALRFIPS